MALQGYGSKSGWGGMNDAYLTDLPQYDYGETTTGQDFTYGGSSGPLSGGDSGGGAANQPTTMNAWDYNMPKSTDPRQFGTPKGHPSERDTFNPKTTEEMWDKLDDQVYNPGTGKWEQSGKYSYPYSTLFPERSGAISNFLTFGTTKPDASKFDLPSMAKGISNFQQQNLDLAHANPNLSVEQLHDLQNNYFTGFDKQGNYSPLPGSDVFNSLPQAHQDHFQHIQDPFHDVPEATGSFSFGNLFGGNSGSLDNVVDSWNNPDEYMFGNTGGKVPGGK